MSSLDRAIAALFQFGLGIAAVVNTTRVDPKTVESAVRLRMNDLEAKVADLEARLKAQS